MSTPTAPTSPIPTATEPVSSRYRLITVAVRKGGDGSMHARDHYAKSKTTFSFEFFPPKNAESAAALFESIRELDALKPSFVSVTYGAGGATRGITQDLVFRIRSEIGLPVVPHLTCV